LDPNNFTGVNGAIIIVTRNCIPVDKGTYKYLRGRSYIDIIFVGVGILGWIFLDFVSIFMHFYNFITGMDSFGVAVEPGNPHKYAHKFL